MFLIEKLRNAFYGMPYTYLKETKFFLIFYRIKKPEKIILNREIKYIIKIIKTVKGNLNKAKTIKCTRD